MSYYMKIPMKTFILISLKKVRLYILKEIGYNFFFHSGIIHKTKGGRIRFRLTRTFKHLDLRSVNNYNKMYSGEPLKNNGKSVIVNAFELIGNGKYKWPTKIDIDDYPICVII